MSEDNRVFVILNEFINNILDTEIFVIKFLSNIEWFNMIFPKKKLKYLTVLKGRVKYKRHSVKELPKLHTEVFSYEYRQLFLQTCQNNIFFNYDVVCILFVIFEAVLKRLKDL